jgi:hypothetical protein
MFCRVLNEAPLVISFFFVWSVCSLTCMAIFDAEATSSKDENCVVISVQSVLESGN